MNTFLNTEKINVELYKDELIKKLTDLLTKFKGTKTLIWDNELVGAFGLLTDYTYLKNNGVTQMYMLQSSGPISTNNVIYLIKPQIIKMKTLIENFNKVEAQKKDYHIVYISSISFICQSILEKENISQYFKTVNEFPIYMFPFDSDLFSMENEFSFKEIYLEEDKNCIYEAACGIMNFQKIYGLIPNILGQGKDAKLLCDILLKKGKEEEKFLPKIVSKIDTLIIIDRSIDLITPLLTQLNYEGIIDEIFGIKNNTCKFSASKFSQNKESNSNSKLINNPIEIKQITLNSKDEIFFKIRNKSIKEVPQTIKNFTKSYKNQFDERHNLKSLTEYKSFINKIPYLTNLKKSLSNHLLITEIIYDLTNEESFLQKIQLESNFLNLLNTDKINPYIEDCIAKNEDYTKVVRLICLQSQINNGLKPKVLNFYRKQIFQAYGFYRLLDIENLIKSGVLRVESLYGKNYAILRKLMKLTPELSNENNDIFYVYAGYIPISVRFCQYLISLGWKFIPEIIKFFPDLFFEEYQELSTLRKRKNSDISLNSNNIVKESKLVLVFFVGGCTYAEISSLRLLSQKNTVNAEFIVATTKLFNGDTFIEYLNEYKF